MAEAGLVDESRRPIRYHDLRHYFVSLLIASGADVKVVQYRVLHRSAKTRLDTYGHLWPDTEESTPTTVERVMSERLTGSSRNGGIAEDR